MAGATDYIVEQLEVGVDTEFTEVGIATAADLTFGAYNPGATVQVRVRARDSQTNESPNSTVEEVTLA